MYRSSLSATVPSRRALLTTGGAILTTVLAGCSLAPSGPSTESYPTSAPNVFASFDWNPDRSTLIVTFDRGNRLTAENTGRLRVVTPDPERVETVWVDRGDTDTASEFPLTPGATLRHKIPAPETTHVVWEGPEQQNTLSVAEWHPETTRSEGGK
jgi:hypothetical protein